MAAPNVLPSREYLWECLEYHSDGFLVWRERPLSHFPLKRIGRNWNARFPGKRAGAMHDKGYRIVGFGGHFYLEHRLIYYMMVGDIPSGHCVDHIDRDPGNNLISNLRLATNAQNLCNRPAQKNGLHKNVYWHCGAQKYVVEVSRNYVGLFPSLDEANAAAQEARLKWHGEFAYDG